MQHVRVIPGSDTGGVIPGDHNWFLAEINGNRAKVQTLTMSGGTFHMWVPVACLEAVPNKIALPGINVKALTELDAWCNKYNVSMLATTTLNTDCPTLWELINNATS